MKLDGVPRLSSADVLAEVPRPGGKRFVLALVIFGIISGIAVESWAVSSDSVRFEEEDEVSQWKSPSALMPYYFLLTTDTMKATTTNLVFPPKFVKTPEAREAERIDRSAPKTCTRLVGLCFSLGFLGLACYQCWVDASKAMAFHSVGDAWYWKMWSWYQHVVGIAVLSPNCAAALASMGSTQTDPKDWEAGGLIRFAVVVKCCFQAVVMPYIACWLPACPTHFWPGAAVGTGVLVFKIVKFVFYKGVVDMYNRDFDAWLDDLHTMLFFSYPMILFFGSFVAASVTAKVLERWHGLTSSLDLETVLEPPQDPRLKDKAWEREVEKALGVSDTFVPVEEDTEQGAEALFIGEITREDIVLYAKQRLSIMMTLAVAMTMMSQLSAVGMIRIWSGAGIYPALERTISERSFAQYCEFMQAKLGLATVKIQLLWTISR